ncbi:MAG: AraC family transcriptional regulator [Eubacteriales bacterium]
MNEPRFSNNFQHTLNSLPFAYCMHDKEHPVLMTECTDGKIPFTYNHNHSEMEMIYIAKGTGSFFIDNTIHPHPFSSGDFILINPYALHYGYFDSPDYKFITFDLLPNMLKNELSFECSDFVNSLTSQNTLLSPIVTPNSPVYGDLQKHFLSVYEAAKKESADDFELLGNLYLLFYDIIKGGHFSVTPESKESSNKEFVKAVNDYIEKNYQSSFSTKDIAHALSYTTEYFCRIFKKNYKNNFNAHLKKFRLKKSLTLLKKYSSTEASELCGFSSTSRFAKEFKKEFGMSPSDYRKGLTDS